MAKKSAQKNEFWAYFSWYNEYTPSDQQVTAHDWKQTHWTI